MDWSLGFRNLIWFDLIWSNIWVQIKFKSEIFKSNQIQIWSNLIWFDKYSKIYNWTFKIISYLLEILLRQSTFSFYETRGILFRWTLLLKSSRSINIVKFFVNQVFTLSIKNFKFFWKSNIQIKYLNLIWSNQIKSRKYLIWSNSNRSNIWFDLILRNPSSN